MYVWILMDIDAFEIVKVYEDEEQAKEEFLKLYNSLVDPEYRVRTFEEADDEDSRLMLFGPEQVH